MRTHHKASDVFWSPLLPVWGRSSTYIESKALRVCNSWTSWRLKEVTCTLTMSLRSRHFLGSPLLGHSGDSRRVLKIMVFFDVEVSFTTVMEAWVYKMQHKRLWLPNTTVGTTDSLIFFGFEKLDFDFCYWGSWLQICLGSLYVSTYTIIL